MSASPLVPAPELPAFLDEDGITVDYQGGVRILRNKNVVHCCPPHAPALAAAILAAAGCENHRVIDLGGPLPEAFCHGGRVDVVGHASWALGTVTASEFMGDVRIQLAAAQALAAQSGHDEAEVHVVARALASTATPHIDFPNGLPFETYRRDARAVLSALSAARSEP